MRAFTIDMARTIVDTIVVFAENEEQAREFAMKKFVDEEAEFPNEYLWETEIVNIDEERVCFGYAQYNAMEE